MKKKKLKAVEEAARPEDGIVPERVVLAPFLGMQPRVYVAALYAVILAGVLFFIFLYPGLARPGSEVRFASLPEEASVLVDGVRVGATPVTVFVPEGRHVVTLRRPHFEEKNEALAAGGRLFGSRFFPKKMDFFAELTPRSSARDILADAHRGFSVWAASGEPSSLYPIPQVLSAAVRDYAVSAAKNAGDELFQMLSQAAASVNSPANFRDFTGAALLAASGGAALTPAALAQAAAWFLPLYAKHPEALYWLILVLPEKARGEFLASSWTQGELKKLADVKTPAVPEKWVSASRKILGVDYAAVPGGAGFRLGGGDGAAAFSRIGSPGAQKNSSADSALRRLRENPPYSVEARVDDFFLQAREISQNEYAAFLRENPAWLPANRAALVKQGLAEDSYLASWKDSPAPPRPEDAVSEVSFYAAEAYCKWLGGRDSRYSFFLPTETEWEYAAILRAPGMQTESGLWEWCGSWYAPAAYIFDTAADASGLPAAEKAVRGGSRINTSITPSTRGAQPPDWCSPYVGFRVAAREK